MKQPPEIVVAGEIFVDLILSGLSGWPEPGKEIFASEFRREMGGGTAITACGLAKLGINVALLAVAGDDWGAWLRDRLGRQNVDVSWVERNPDEPTAFTIIATMPHDRAFLTYSGANRSFEAALRKRAAAHEFSAVRHVHLAYAPSPDSANSIFKELRANGCTISIDFGWREEWVCNPNSLSLLRDVDIVFPNETEARQLTGAAEPEGILAGFRDAGVKRVALKLGSRGAALLWDGEIMLVDRYPVTAVDTTGAGDCFDAGFLYGSSRGETPQTCLRIANICGALSTREYGGIAGFPSLDQLTNEMNKTNPCAR